MPLPSGKTAKELGFREGDNFKVVEKALIFSFNVGDIFELSFDDNTSSPLFKRLSDKMEFYAYFHCLEPLPKTLDNLAEGDVLVSKNSGAEHKILGVCGKVFFISSPNNFEETNNGTWALPQIKRVFDLKESSPQQTIELSMDEIASKFGVDVKDLKIKKEM